MKEPNYRIYDRTGGGATQDIYAPSLDDAIQQGREWIEAGDWSSEDGVIRLGVDLRAEVRPIVRTSYYIDVSCTGCAADRRGPYSSIVEARAAAKAIRELIEECDVEERYYADTLRDENPNADVSHVESYATGGGDCDYTSIYSVTGPDVDGPIDDDATREQDAYDCSGSHSDEEPECEVGGGDDDGGHDWRAPHSLVGGLRDNPGVWATGGTATSSKTVCARCGCYRIEVDAGSQRNDGEPEATVEYQPADADSEAWLVRIHDEDGWLPDWLADRLGRPPTTRYTDEEARQYVIDHTDDDADGEELDHVFAALHGLRADDKDRAEGLWSHCVQCVHG